MRCLGKGERAERALEVNQGSRRGKFKVGVEGAGVIDLRKQLEDAGFRQLPGRRGNRVWLPQRRAVQAHHHSLARNEREPAVSDVEMNVTSSRSGVGDVANRDADEWHGGSYDP